MAYTTRSVGQPDTLDYKMYFFDKDGTPVSAFHDIPLWANQEKKIANMVVEIPKGTQAKLEINKGEYLNAIKQDVKNGKLRYVALKYPFNYGAFPQTWENPAVVHPDTKAKGDNDPLDVVDISASTGKTGEIRHVKILGTYAMIDEGETDWKILCIDVNDPHADKLNDLEDIEKVFPGKLKEVFEFLRDYKIPDGKPANKFAYNDVPQNKAFAYKVIAETAEEWHKLVHNKAESKGISVVHTHGDTPNKISRSEAESKINLKA